MTEAGIAFQEYWLMTDSLRMFVQVFYIHIKSWLGMFKFNKYTFTNLVGKIMSIRDILSDSCLNQ